MLSVSVVWVGEASSDDVCSFIHRGGACALSATYHHLRAGAIRGIEVLIAGR